MKIRFEKEEVYSVYFKSENLHDAEVELSETELSFYHSSMLYFDLAQTMIKKKLKELKDD